MSEHTDIIRIRRAKHGELNPYFLSARQSAQDRQVSHEARGVLWYLLSKPDDWELQPKDIEQPGCGRDKTTRIINELIAAGYVTKTQEREKGKFLRNVYEVFETPFTEKPSTVEPSTVNPSHTEYREEQSTEDTEKDSSAPENGAGDVEGDLRAAQEMEAIIPSPELPTESEAAPELPWGWRPIYTMILSQALRDENGKVLRYNRAVNQWDGAIHALEAGGYMTAVNGLWSKVTDEGRALAPIPAIAAAVAKTLTPKPPPKPRPAKGKSQARKDYELETMSVGMAEICKIIAIHYHKRAYDFLCRSERGQVVKASADFDTPQEAEQTIAYARHMLSEGAWPQMCAVTNLGKYKTAAEQWRKQGSGLFLGVTSSTEVLPPMDAGAGVSVIGDNSERN